MRLKGREVREGFNKGKQVKGGSMWTEDGVREGQSAALGPFRIPREALSLYDDAGI